MHAAAGHLDRRLGDLVGVAQPVQIAASTHRGSSGRGVGGAARPAAAPRPGACCARASVVSPSTLAASGADRRCLEELSSVHDVLADYGSANAHELRVRRRPGARGNVERRVAAAGDRRDVLLAVGALIGQRRHQHVVVERRPPQLLAGLPVERAEAEVGRRADEHESARRRDRPAVVHRGARAQDALRRQLRVLAERRAPHDVARAWCSRRRAPTTAARCTDTPADRRRSSSASSTCRTTAARRTTCSSAAAR